MNDIDQLARQLLEQAKRFLEIADGVREESGEMPYCIAALLTGFSSLEAHVNAMAEELAERKGLGVMEKSILCEREIKLDSGKYTLTKSLKMYRLEDRISFIIANFSKANFPPKEAWWGDVIGGTKLRNALVHPKDKVEINVKTVRQSLIAIVELLNYLYDAVYGKAHPAYNRGAHSDQTF